MHALITGGSRGIGAAAVRAFCRKGYTVTFLYEKNHDAARSIAEEAGAKAICCDVADAAAVKDALKGMDIDVLVNNAGISHAALLSQTTEAQWDRLFDVNVKGIYNCVGAAMSSFLQKQAGSIVNVSSMWGQVGASMEAAYSATKGAVIALTKALAKELGPSGIRVNCVAPGVIVTDMCKDLPAEILESLREESPIGKLGTAEDVADAIVYLAEAKFVTGEVLSVNGGLVI